MNAFGLGIELGARARGAQASYDDAAVVVDDAGVVGLDGTGAVVVGDAASGGVTGFLSELGRAEPYLVGGVPYGGEALVAQLLRHVFDRAAAGADGPPVATALVHDDTWGPYQLDLLREAVRLAAVGPVHLLPAAAAAAYDPDLAVGAARWAWAQRDDGTAVPALGSPISARTVLLGVGAGGALAIGGGAAIAGAAGESAAPAGASLGDFAGREGGSNLGDFAGREGGSNLGDFAGREGGSNLGDFATPKPSAPAKAAKAAKRSLKVPAAVGAAVVAVAVVAGVALASSGRQDEPADEQAAAITTTTEAEPTTSTSESTSTSVAGDSDRLRTPFLLACGGEGPAGAGTGGPAVAASCGRPLDVAIADDGTVYFTDRPTRGSAPSTVRAVLPDGTLRSFDFGEVDGKRIDDPTAVAVADDGTLYVADLDNHRILRRAPSGVVTRYAGLADGTMAGSTSSGTPIPIGENVPAREAPIGNVFSLALDDAGNLFFNDLQNDIVQRVDASGILSTIAGRDRQPTDSAAASVPAVGANLTNLMQGGPVAVEFDRSGRLHIAGTHSIWRLDGGDLVRVAANGERPKAGADQTGKSALEASFWIDDIAFAPDGALYVTEVDQATIWRAPLGGGGTVVRALGGELPSPANGPTATRISPSGIAIDAEGRIVLSEDGTSYEMVRRFPATTSSSS